VHRITAQLHGWKSSRIAQDDVLWKPKGGGSPVGYHRDSTYISDQFMPRMNNSITVWMPLDDVSLETGTLEYVEGSTQWKKTIAEGMRSSTTTASQESFHCTNPTSSLEAAAHSIVTGDSNSRLKIIHSGEYVKDPTQVGTDEDDITTFSYIQVPKGGVAFHHQDLVHGSGSNTSPQHHRRALVLHTLDGACSFNPTKEPSYIYGRYKLLHGDKGCELHERFFPVCWAQTEMPTLTDDPKINTQKVDNVKSPSTRSSWLNEYHCLDLPCDQILLRFENLISTIKIIITSTLYTYGAWPHHLY
jgi:hypothetical protein